MIIVNGNIVKDAETRLVTNSQGQKTMVTDFRVAENTGYGENQLHTFYKVTIWGERGSKLQPYLKSGKGVSIAAATVSVSPYLTKENKPAATIELRRIVELKLLDGSEEIAFKGEIVE